MSLALKLLTDEELYYLVKDNNQYAYAELYERFKRPLLVYALKKLDEEAVAEDIVHDIFVKLWDNREEIILEGRFANYIFSALRNKILDHFARSSNSRKYLDSLTSFSTQFTSNSTDYKLREESYQNTIDELLNKYGSNAQAIIRLRMQGYNNQEIAERLNLSEKSIRNQKSAIVKYLKSKLPHLMLIIFVISHFFSDK